MNNVALWTWMAYILFIFLSTICTSQPQTNGLDLQQMLDGMCELGVTEVRRTGHSTEAGSHWSTTNSSSWYLVPTQVINENISSSDRATHRETMKNKPRDLHQNWPKPWNLHWLHVILGTKKLQILDIALSLCWKWKYQNLRIKCNHLQNLIKYKSQIRNEFCFTESPLF